MLSKGKVALQSLAIRIREWSPREMSQSWGKKLGQLFQAVDKKAQALEEWWNRTFAEAARLKRVWLWEDMWSDPFFRIFVYIVLILYFIGA